jgi:1,4-dihydroxy-6-naphthoate synthase
MTRTIRVAHSPDSDDAFMFYALAEGRIDTGDLRYVHELSDIESLNQRARRAELEVTAVSIHAYAYLWRTYALLGSGSSMGDGYGPRLVATRPRPDDPRAGLRGLKVGVPGALTTAYLALQLYQPHVTP